MLDVVLDEGPYIRALESECTRDRDDLAWAAVVTAIQRSHRWVLTVRVEAAYRRQFASIRCKGSVTSELMKSLNQVLFNASRVVLVHQPVNVSGDFDPDDAHVVCAAASVRGSVLITIDEKLARDLDRNGVSSRHGFAVATLQGALERLGIPL